MGCCGIGFGNTKADPTRRDWNRQRQMSGNQAFDEYRAETLRRLEEEQREFREFLSRLRVAKDRAEFDQFMVARRTPLESAQPQT